MPAHRRSQADCKQADWRLTASASARAPRAGTRNPQLPPDSSFSLAPRTSSHLPLLAQPNLHRSVGMDFDSQVLQTSEQLISCDNLEPAGREDCDGHNVEIPSTPDASLPLDGSSANTMRAETFRGPADPGSWMQPPTTVSPQDLELAWQPTGGCPVTPVPEELATLAIVGGAEDQQGQSTGLTGGSNTKDAGPPAQSIESPAQSSAGHPTAAHQAPGRTLGEPSEAPTATTTGQGAGTPAEAQMASPTHDRRLPTLDGHSDAPLATATIREAGAPVEAQSETQAVRPSHHGRLEEPKTREAFKDASNHPTVDRQPSDTTLGSAFEQPSHRERAGDRPAGCAGARLLRNDQNDADVRQDFPNEIDDSLPDAPARPARKRRMEDDAAAETTSARRKLRQSPSKASRPGFISWKEVLSKPDAIGSAGGMLEQVKDWSRRDDHARSRELRRVRKEIRGMQTRLDGLWDKIRYLEEQEDDAREQTDALGKLPAITWTRLRSRLVASLELFGRTFGMVLVRILFPFPRRAYCWLGGRVFPRPFERTAG